MGPQRSSNITRKTWLVYLKRVDVDKFSHLLTLSVFVSPTHTHTHTRRGVGQGTTTGRLLTTSNPSEKKQRFTHTSQSFSWFTSFRVVSLETLAEGKRQTSTCDTIQNNEAGFRGVTYPACCSCPHSRGLVLSVTWTHTHLWTCHSRSITPGACKAILFTSKRRGPAGTSGCRKDIDESDLLSSASSILWWLDKTSSQEGKVSDFNPPAPP